MKKIRTLLFFFLLVYTVTGHIFGDTVYDPLELTASQKFSFPDNSGVRKEYRQAILSDFRNVYRIPAGITVDERSGRRVKFRVAKQRDNFYLIFVNELQYRYPLYSQGTYIIRKNISDGEINQVKIFIYSHKGCSVKIVPRGSRSSLSLWMYGRILYKDVPVPVDIITASLLPFHKIASLTERIINWELIFPDVPEYDNAAAVHMIEQVREALPVLAEEEDGAMDARGKFVFIETLEPQPGGGLNCSGFAKWMADGIYYPYAERYMEIPDLKRRNTEIRGHRWSDRYETERDPYFGLDWTRNIAAQIYSVIQGKDVSPEYADVREVPFFEYIDDMGYPVRDARLIFFFLLHHEPGHFYLASINEELGDDVRLRQHYHVAVFFPYYTETGEFEVAVFERTRETALDDFISDYSESAMHLVRLPVSNKFVPPMLNIRND